jgi:hypothetical protein
MSQFTRFWKLKDSDRVIATNCQMTARWEEITISQFNEYRKLAEKI